jgi:hypothetical protein
LHAGVDVAGEDGRRFSDARQSFNNNDLHSTHFTTFIEATHSRDTHISRSLNNYQIHDNMRLHLAVQLIVSIAVALLSFASKAALVRSFPLP